MPREFFVTCWENLPMRLFNNRARRDCSIWAHGSFTASACVRLARSFIAACFAATEPAVDRFMTLRTNSCSERTSGLYP
ncbi:hypothetical protein HMPREF2863_04150 [Micrococcus sp. HMSC067E09]|nr:hypothetical protein HMPREF2863_04150 [Micrococcus sp. HMSC067E09]